jgi:hypothetical protein
LRPCARPRCHLAAGRVRAQSRWPTRNPPGSRTDTQGPRKPARPYTEGQAAGAVAPRAGVPGTDMERGAGDHGHDDDAGGHGSVLLGGWQGTRRCAEDGGHTLGAVAMTVKVHLGRARARRKCADTVAIAGCAATVNQYLAAALTDDLWLHIAPVTLGAGERLLDGVELTLEPIAARHTDLVTHVRCRVLHQLRGASIHHR